MVLNINRLEEYKTAVAVPASVQVHGTILSVAAAPVEAAIDMQRTVMDEMKKQDAYTTTRVARQETTIDGQRIAVKSRKAKE
jgi:hypothetical protein